MDERYKKGLYGLPKDILVKLILRLKHDHERENFLLKKKIELCKKWNVEFGECNEKCCEFVYVLGHGKLLPCFVCDKLFCENHLTYADVCDHKVCNRHVTTCNEIHIKEEEEDERRSEEYSETTESENSEEEKNEV